VDTGFLEPAYGARSLSDVLPSVGHAIGARVLAWSAAPALTLPEAPSYVVFLVDGLGADLLAAHAHAAQFHRRTQVEPVDRLVEIDDEALRLGEKVHPSERQQRDESENERTQNKEADNGGTDLGLHDVSIERGFRNWTGLMWERVTRRGFPRG